MGRMSVNAGGGGADLDAITAGAEDIVSPKIGLDNEGEPLAGTLKDNSGATKSAAASLDTANSRVQLTVPETGKYSLTSKLYATYATIRSLIGLTADKLWTGVTILGLKSNRSALAAKTWTPGTANQTIAAGTCVTGAQTIKGDSNLKAENIRMGVPIFGIIGTFRGTITSGETKLTNKGHVTFTNVNGTTRDLYAMELTGHGITPMMAAFWNDSYSVIWCRGWDSARVYYHANTNCVYVYHTNTTYYCMTSTSLVLPLPLTGTYQWAVCGY